MKKNIKVAILVMDNSLVSAVTGLDDIFNINNNYVKEDSEVEFTTSYVCIERLSESSNSKVILKTQVISDKDEFDIIILPPMSADKELLKSFPKLNQWLISMYHKGSLLSAACVGSFLLAHTGLLDNKRATTHWLLEDEFKSIFKNVILNSEKILIDEGRIITAGGVTAYIDLALYLIERFNSGSSANRCANLLLVDRGRDSQRCYKDLSINFLVDDEEIKELLEWMKKNLDKELSSKSLSLRLKLQERTFLRRFKKSVRITPNQYLQNLRIEQSKKLLINSSKSFDEITYEVGFFNESSFRRLFKRETSLNPGEYRKKFQRFF